MIFAVFDTETTGLGPKDEVVEVAAVFIDTNKPEPKHWGTFSTLVKPSVPVCIDARTNHHITDAELAAAPTMIEVMESMDHMALLCGKKVTPVAHNLAFDVRLLKQSGVVLAQPAICTLQCARHLFPESPRHTNQYLRYGLNLDVPTLNLQGNMALPHRALFDAIVTSALLVQKLLYLKPASALLLLTNKKVEFATCNIRKYKGKKWKDITDKGWLEWIVGSDFDEDTKFTAQQQLNRLKGK